MDGIERIRTQFAELTSARRGGEPGWLSLVRREALERFLDRGFPTTRQEEWRFTNIAPLASSSFELALNGPNGTNGSARSLLEKLQIADWDRHEIVLVDGRYREDLSALGELPEGVVVTSLARALEERTDAIEPVLSRPAEEHATPFADLNRAFASDGLFVYIPKGTLVEAPIHCVFLTMAATPTVAHPRNVIIAERQSQARIVETYGGTHGRVYFTNVVTEISAGNNAVVDHYKIQRESEEAFHLASIDLTQARSANLSNYSLSIGGRLVRNDIRALLDGDGGDLTLNGLYVVHGSQHVDHHTVIDHSKPHCTSRELYKGILDGAATGVFNGRVIVRPDAQKTDARQTNKNLLLSKDAIVNTNPQLEINADDVKCAHGATIGQLDADALFYLRTRGIGLDEARKILTQGFVADISDRIRIEAIRDAMHSVLFAENGSRS